MISVIVPTCNEEELLPLCLASVKAQEISCELIGSNGASQDKNSRAVYLAVSGRNIQMRITSRL
jgi:glycosyltransferase involved in cell wall biosynthesis